MMIAEDDFDVLHYADPFSECGTEYGLGTVELEDVNCPACRESVVARLARALTQIAEPERRHARLYAENRIEAETLVRQIMGWNG